MYYMKHFCEMVELIQKLHNSFTGTPYQYSFEIELSTLQI